MRFFYLILSFCFYTVTIYANTSIEYSGNYSPVSSNQYGVDTGIVIFPDTITWELQEKYKAVYPNSLWLPWIWEWGTDSFSKKTQPYPHLDYELLWNMQTSIPQTDDFTDQLIDTLGNESIFLSLLWVWQKPWTNDTTKKIQTPIMRIIGSEYRCKTPRIVPQSDYIARPGSVLTDVSYRACQFEEKKEIHANTVNNKQFRLISEQEQSITFRVYPIDPYNYKFGDRNIQPILQLIDPLMDYHNIQIMIGKFGSIPSSQSIDIQKKYTKFTYSHTSWNANTTIVYPYYEVTATLPAGESRMDIMYYSYTPTDGNAFFIVE